MGYSPWDHKELDTIEQLALTQTNKIISSCMNYGKIILLKKKEDSQTCTQEDKKQAEFKTLRL